MSGSDVVQEKGMNGKKALVTGGAGFIGSHLVDRLVKDGAEVTVVDNLSSGRKEFIEGHIAEGTVDFVEDDLLSMDLQSVMKGMDVVFHIAANPDVRAGARDTAVHLEQNVMVTHRVLEAMRTQGVKEICFTSTSTVYGEASVIPTPEDYGPLYPISLYGASKLAAEALIYSYCGTFDMRAVVWRFANVVGPRSTHGVTYDFIRKLRANPRELEILGDGRQRKSYVYISDVIDAMMHSYLHSGDRMAAYNIGSEDAIDVRQIADIVVSVLGLEGVEYSFTGGIDGGRGWKGDIKYMGLAIDKLKAMGWKPRYSSAEAVRLTAEHLAKNM